MRNTLLTASALVIAGFAAPTALADERAYPIDDFNNIDASAGVTVNLHQGPFSVIAEEEDGDFDKLELVRRGDTLKISRKNSWGFGSSKHYTVTVTAPEYERIEASSGSQVSGDNLRLARVDIDASSGARVELSGECSSLSAEVSSGSSIDADNLHCESATADASSGGSMRIYASSTARGDASSGGSVRISGNPKSLTKDTSSGGSVRAD